jgi:hypothetical protein
VLPRATSKHAPQKGIVGEAVNTCFFHEIGQLLFHILEMERFQELWDLLHGVTRLSEELIILG